MGTPRNDITVRIAFDYIHYISQSNDPKARGAQRPYVWWLFFKVDGETLMLVNGNVGGKVTGLDGKSDPRPFVSGTWSVTIPTLNPGEAGFFQGGIDKPSWSSTVGRVNKAG